jgi:hypothetical protein
MRKTYPQTKPPGRFRRPTIAEVDSQAFPDCSARLALLASLAYPHYAVAKRDHDIRPLAASVFPKR